MNKISLLAIAMIVLAALCVPAQAATIRGTVLDQALPHAGLIPYGSVELSRKSGTSWVHVDSSGLSESQTTFSFEGLAAGTYGLRIEGYNYVTEYYDNTTLYASRAEITVAAAETRDVGTIYAGKLFIRLANVSLSGDEVPPEGGRITATFDVVNDTATDQDVVVVAILDAARNIRNATRVHGLIQAGKRSLTVPAHSTVTSTKAIDIPGTAAAGTMFGVYLDLTHDTWKPLANREKAGYILKHP